MWWYSCRSEYKDKPIFSLDKICLLAFVGISKNAKFYWHLRPLSVLSGLKLVHLYVNFQCINVNCEREQWHAAFFVSSVFYNRISDMKKNIVSNLFYSIYGSVQTSYSAVLQETLFAVENILESCHVKNVLTTCFYMWVIYKFNCIPVLSNCLSFSHYRKIIFFGPKQWISNFAY